jgi:hypothetical protein
MKILATIETTPKLCIVPSDPFDCPELFKLEKLGELELSISKTRDISRHRKTWATYRWFLDNLPEHLEDQFQDHSLESVHDYFRYAVGYTDKVMVDGRIYEKPRHTRFSDADDEVKYVQEYYQPMMDRMAHMLGYATAFELQDVIFGR